MNNTDLPEYLSEQLKLRLELLSLSTGRTVRFYLRSAVQEYLQQQEAALLAAEHSHFAAIKQEIESYQRGLRTESAARLGEAASRRDRI